MDIYAAQKMFGRGRTFDRIDLAVKRGTTHRGLPARAARPPRPRASRFSRRPAEAARPRRSGRVRVMVDISSAFALFIGMFIIYNAFAIAVTQRRSEIAILRALGATRRQVGGCSWPRAPCWGRWDRWPDWASASCGRARDGGRNRQPGRRPLRRRATGRGRRAATRAARPGRGGRASPRAWRRRWFPHKAPRGSIRCRPCRRGVQQTYSAREHRVRLVLAAAAAATSSDVWRPTRGRSSISGTCSRLAPPCSSARR